MSPKFLLLFTSFCLLAVVVSTAKWNRRTERDFNGWANLAADFEDSEEEANLVEESDEMSSATFWEMMPWRWPKAHRVPLQRVQKRNNNNNRAGSNSPLGRQINNGYKAWAEYKRQFGKFYHDQALENERMMAFLKNREFVAKHNKMYEQGRVSYKVGLNHLSDLSPREYKKLNGYRHDLASSNRERNASRFLAPMNVGDVPESIDWRDHGYVTPVKDQANCGSCWAFSATGALEGQHMRATGKLVSLSEQNLVDCSKENSGCDGGAMDLAFKYVKTNKGIDTEKSYPYKAEDEKCHFKRSAVGATDTGLMDLPTGDEDALMKAVATQGPISVAIDASGSGFQSYTSGVYKDDTCASDPSALDHGVLVVGYGTDPQEGDYWIVKNSWGRKWGMNGYILMARNYNNQCGIATDASYPLV